MALDPNIALGVKPLELANPLAQYAQVAQIQSAQNQNQVSQMQLDQMKRDEATMQQIQAKSAEHGGPSDLNEIATAYLKSGNPKFVEFGVGLRQKLDDHAQFAKIMGMGQPTAAEPAAAPTAPMPAPTNALGSGTFGMGQPTAPVNALAGPPAASVNALAGPTPNLDVAMLRQKRDAFLAMGTPQATAAARAMDAEIALISKDPTYHVVPGVGLVDPRNSRVITPSVDIAPSEVKEYEYAKKQGFKGSLFDFKREMAFAGRAPATPSAPVAVVDPVTGKQIYVSREQALSGKMTPAAAMESLPPKEIQKREAALPQATTAIKGFETKSDNFITDLQRLRDHPGLSQITGLVAGRVPAVTSEGRAAQALYDKVVAKGGFQALQDMRDASKTGGALGNVSNQEGKQLTASFAAIQRTQDAKDVRAAIDDAVANIQGAKTRMREAYDSTYSYKTGNAPASGGVIDFGSLK
jgi:hypothetical protein